VVFDFTFGNIKPEIPLVSPLIAGTGNQLHDFDRSLSGPRSKRARSELCNLMSNFPFLPMQTVMFGEDFHIRLTTIRGCRPDILRQGNHSIRSQLVDLDLKPLQDLRHKATCRQTKASSEKCLKNDQLALGLGNLLHPRDTPTPLPKYPSCCMSCTRAEEIRETPNSTVSPGCSSSAATFLKVSSDDASTGGVFAAGEEKDGMATYRRRRRAVCLTRARYPTSRSKEGRRAGERFQKEARVFAARRKRTRPASPHPPF
jgi:hypothetical protein